uniref:RNase H type-1 domain-containing protein n=1 Tax=Hordeum vulgare subsp. vulgare TaxID=112509 RepID=A0A8I7B4L5_HORVV
MTGQKILNVDAFYSENDFTGACGAVIRNNRGGFIRAATARLDHVPDVVSAEAAALLEGLKLVESTGCNNLLVRMDNLTVVQALHNNEGHSMVGAPILQDCRVMLREFGKAVVEHCI